MEVGKVSMEENRDKKKETDDGTGPLKVGDSI